MLGKAGLLRRLRGTEVEIPDRETADYLKGFWFEEYVYMAARSPDVDEVLLNVRGKWDAAGRKAPKNEFDVLVSRKNRLFFMSCKTANPDRKETGGDGAVGKKYLYELDSLGDSALGLFGKKMLVSARRIDDEYVRKRAEVMKIAVIDGSGIRTLKENLRQWLVT